MVTTLRRPFALSLMTSEGAFPGIEAHSTPEEEREVVTSTLKASSDPAGSSSTTVTGCRLGSRVPATSAVTPAIEDPFAKARPTASTTT